MGAPGIREFIKWYYPQLKKEGLVIDVRANGGGNVSRMIIERLSRKVLGINYNNYSEDGGTYPDGAFLGPMITILDENSASDGDIFPYMFREAGLGQLVGKRSWGGVVGISNRGTLIDGGTVNVPQSALANRKGEYVIEGYGVDPDIEVDNDPRSIIAGHDQATGTRGLRVDEKDHYAGQAAESAGGSDQEQELIANAASARSRRPQNIFRNSKRDGQVRRRRQLYRR